MEFDLKGEADIKPIIIKCFKNVFSKSNLALFEFMFLGSAEPMTKSKLKTTYEGSKAKAFGLPFSEQLDWSPPESLVS